MYLQQFGISVCTLYSWQLFKHLIVNQINPLSVIYLQFTLRTHNITTYLTNNYINCGIMTGNDLKKKKPIPYIYI